ncbi:MAG: ROK family protein [Xanthomonadaceae bacterium]|nr:ROK family protein [Xanthomonadaceae bacterium]
MKAKKTSKTVIAIDIGGTKIACAVVSRGGKILYKTKELSKISQGKDSFIDQIERLVHGAQAHSSGLKEVGIACAGPLDSYGGVLLDPTNFRTNGKTWGLFPILKKLHARMPKLTFTLENDAAAAILAEKWIGAARPYQNAMIMTLGTGLGASAMVSGSLVRASHRIHPDAGLILVNYDDLTAPCGSGNYGSAESYLSGGNFVKRARTALGNQDLNVHDVLKLARKSPIIKKMLSEYAEVFAITLYNYATIYGPEIVILSGSFADAHALFLPKAKQILKKLLVRRHVGKINLMPKIVLSPLGNNSCLLGGAYVAFFDR